VSIGPYGKTDVAKFPPVGAAAKLPKEAGALYQHIAFVELDRWAGKGLEVEGFRG
jgi:hypothetical protein